MTEVKAEGKRQKAEVRNILAVANRPLESSQEAQGRSEERSGGGQSTIGVKAEGKRQKSGTFWRWPIDHWSQGTRQKAEVRNVLAVAN